MKDASLLGSRHARSAGRPAWTRLRRIQLFGLALAMIAVSCGGGGNGSPSNGTSDPDEQYTIQYTSVIVTGATSNQLENWLFDQVEERSGDRVTVERFNDGSLMSGVESLSAVQDGRVQGAFWMHPYNPGESVLFEVAGLPFQTENEYSIAWTLWELYNEDELFREELHGLNLRPVFFGYSPSAFTSITDPVDSLEDMRGLRLRVVGTAVGDAFRDIGVEPVAVDPIETYEAIERGVLDGSGAWVMEAAAANAIYEVAPHIVQTGFGVYTGWGLFLRYDTWNELPADIQAIFDEVSNELTYETGPEIYAEGAMRACGQFLDAGGSVTFVPEEETAAWRERVLEPIVDNWVAQVVDRTGMSEDEVRAWRQSFLDRLAANDAKAAELGFMTDLEGCLQEQERRG